jgi:hypothetical protein
VTHSKQQQAAFHLPLHPEDTPTQTFGCRHTRPTVCARNLLPVCAFTRADTLCLAPPVTWKRQFMKLNAAPAPDEAG